MSVDKKLNLHFANTQGVMVSESNEHGTMVLARGNVTPSALQEVQRYYRTPLTLKLISDEVFSEKLSEFYEEENKMTLAHADDLTLDTVAEELHLSEEILDTGNDAPVIRLINAILFEAIQKDASDVHFETFEKHMVIRLRIDGILHDVLELQPELASYVIARIKVMAKLDLAEKRTPQDGRISLSIANRSIDVRVSIIPTTYSERAVLRLLDKSTTQLNLDSIGLSKYNLENVKKLIQSPYGIILVTGPTGSGKTTTLYGMLSALNNKDRNILTIEDPIEYLIPGIGQMQTNEKVNMTFAKGLRAILRQDPDIIMVGEIRDLETAEIAVQASLTGHLVFSTLHTNTATDTIIRLEDMGLAAYLVCSSLIGIISQRLVRKLCIHCREKEALTQTELAILIADNSTLKEVYKAVGCQECDFTGYKGRTAICEIVIVDDKLRLLLKESANEYAIREYTQMHGKSMKDDGLQLVEQGITSFQELVRVVYKASS